MNSDTIEFAGLKCLAVDALPAGTRPQGIVVLCHGFGAPGTDLAGLAPEILSCHESISANYRFYFPAAPIDLGPMGMPGGRAWWPINMARLAQMHDTKNYEELTKVIPDGMPEASEQLAKAVREIQAENGVGDDATVLGGFSQGAMVTTDIVLRRGFQPAHLVVFSGTLLCDELWRQAAADHAGCPVLQSHGRQDMVLPFDAAEWLQELLTENGFSVDFHPFNGPHTISQSVLTALAEVLIAKSS